MSNTFPTATCQKDLDRAKTAWTTFQISRIEMLTQISDEEGCYEKVTENILSELLTSVLGWSKTEVKYQQNRCDIILSDSTINRFLIEAKRPNAFTSQANLNAAKDQALRYGKELQIPTIAISDGVWIKAWDITDKGLIERVDSLLDTSNFPEELWLLTKHGIYRKKKSETIESLSCHLTNDNLLHPKHKLPARCFAYVKCPNTPSTWALPYKLINGSIDLKRLPKAIQCIVSNYRGQKVGKIPLSAIPTTLKTLEAAAISLRLMPHQNPQTANVYQGLAMALAQFNKNNL